MIKAGDKVRVIAAEDTIEESIGWIGIVVGKDDDHDYDWKVYFETGNLTYYYGTEQLELTDNDSNFPDGPELKLNNPIEPTHYRKGSIDLYESWYLTRPFNEVRAILESIAERYIKRDKNDRAEDISKAIYTLERLKEYEIKNKEEAQ